METLNKYWKFILGLFLTIAGLFLYERSKRKDAESNLIQSDSKKDNEVLNARIEESTRALEDAKKQVEEEKARKLSDEELLEKLRKI